MPRGGSKPGERRGGRKPGSHNVATAPVKLTLAEEARQHAPEVLMRLVAIVKGGEGIGPAAQVAAAREILDRAYGKAPQALTIGGEPGGQPIREVIEIVGILPEPPK